ncbi:MAG: alpha-glucosidase [Lachnospiraceae bacterium]|nr:alpha-glucosidase [Lachnospiraceae bacterium]
MKREPWQRCAAYQIYPKSFMDSNGDGIGDLRGILSKLDYLKDLGIDILWLSPIYCSPLADEGYDISDYFHIDPRFGTMEDMQELLAEADKRGIRVLMDLVVNHCSDEHEWFQKACKDPDGPYGKYFYIVDANDPNPVIARNIRAGKAPTNWRSYFGGSAWDKLPGHDDKYYLHLFHKKQPDLNWENPALRQEVYAMVNWWLDRGLAGFRIDAIINIKKALPMHDYPADRPDGMCSLHEMLVEAEGVGVFLRELREETFAKHNAFTVGEVFDIEPDEIRDYIGDDGYFSTMFDFSAVALGTSPKGWYDFSEVDPVEYIESIYRTQETVGDNGFMSNIIENHDEPRGASHFLPEGNVTLAGKKMLAVITMMKRGLPFLYQGQEIGMENCDFPSIDAIDDCSSKDAYEVALSDGCSEEKAMHALRRMSRDNSRTPMQWSDEENAGFTTGRPWMMCNPNYTSINVASQIHDPASLYSLYKELIALRKSEEYGETVVYGDFVKAAGDDPGVMAFYRLDHKKKLLVIANYQNREGRYKLTERYKKILINNTARLQETGQELILEAYQAVILEMTV